MEVENNRVHAEENDIEFGGENSPSNSEMTGKKRKHKETLTPIIERPARERKSVDRFVISAEKETKEFKFEKGSGTILKDIPNVVYKLSKRKGTDEVVQLLHKILYGKQAKSHAVKSNILQFSGYVWGENEDKEKIKIKEKLEKCRKEILVQMSDLVDLNLFKSTRKEDAVLKLFTFLESPYKTTDKLLEEKIKESKMKRMKKKVAKPKKTEKKTPQKRKSQECKASSDNENSDEEGDDYGISDQEDNLEVDSEDNSEDDYSNDHEVSRKAQQSKNKSTKKPRKTDSEDKSDATSTKTKEIRNTEIKAKIVSKPSDDELQTVIREILQKADFTKVTLADVLKQLGEKFSLDLAENKAHLRTLIQTELARIAENGNDDSEDEDGDSDNEENNDVKDDKGQVEKGNNDVEDDKGRVEKGNNDVEDDKGQVDKGNNHDEDDKRQVEKGNNHDEDSNCQVDKGNDHDEGQVDKGNNNHEDDKGQVDKENNNDEDDNSPVGTGNNHDEDDKGQSDKDVKCENGNEADEDNNDGQVADENGCQNEDGKFGHEYNAAGAVTGAKIKDEKDSEGSVSCEL